MMTGFALPPWVSFFASRLGILLAAGAAVLLLLWRLDVVGDQRDIYKLSAESLADHVEAQSAALKGWQKAAEANESARVKAEERARGVWAAVTRELAAGRPEAAAEAAAAFLRGTN